MVKQNSFHGVSYNRVPLKIIIVEGEILKLKNVEHKGNQYQYASFTFTTKGGNEWLKFDNTELKLGKKTIMRLSGSLKKEKYINSFGEQKYNLTLYQVKLISVFDETNKIWIK